MKLKSIAQIDYEQLTAHMEQSNAAFQQEDAVAAAQTHLQTWLFLCSLMDYYHFESIEDLLGFDEEKAGEWSLGIVEQLNEAAHIDRQYSRSLIEFCSEFISRSHNTDDILLFLLKLSMGKAYFLLGGQIAGDIAFEQLVSEYPALAVGWLSWAEQYSLREITGENTARAISILERARGRKDLDEREDLLTALLELYERDDPWGERAENVAQELDDLFAGRKSDEDDDGGDEDGIENAHPDDCGCGHHHHHGEEHNPEETAAAAPGRNDPCPCGSGKKYKKCCGA
jgi:hypothetical protein